MADGKIFTTGFSKMSERQLGLWDLVRDGGSRPASAAAGTPRSRGHTGCRGCSPAARAPLKPHALPRSRTQRPFWGTDPDPPTISLPPLPRADSLPLPPGEVCPPRRAAARAGYLHAGRTHLYHGLYQNEPAGAGLVGPGNEAAWSAAPGTWPPPRPTAPLPPPPPQDGVSAASPTPKKCQVPKCAVLCRAMGRGRWGQGVLGGGKPGWECWGGHKADWDAPSQAGKQEWGRGCWGGMPSCLPGGLCTLGRGWKAPSQQCAVANECD